MTNSFQGLTWGVSQRVAKDDAKWSVIKQQGTDHQVDSQHMN